MQLVQRVAGSEGDPRVVVDRPLTPEEISEFKRHLAFLREHKRSLKLKLNAQEDLLLNGAREPDSRGVCHHLLSKIDYQTVAHAAERLPKDERPALIAGVLGFKDELPYLLLYLEALKDAGSRDAPRALEGALERIDYRDVSEGQMRRVLELVVETFADERRASLLLGLLQNRTFRAAFDQTLSKLEGPLAELLSPVRALQAVVLAGEPNPSDAAALSRGLELALRDGLQSFERRPWKVRARLLEQLTERAPHCLEQSFGTVLRLLESIDASSPERRRLEWLVIQTLLRLHQEKRAEKRLSELLERYPNDREARALKDALNAPRVSGCALLRAAQKPEPAHVNEGVLLENQRPIWVRLVSADGEARVEEQSRLHSGLHLPGVASLVFRAKDGGRSVLGYERRGEALLPNHALLQHRDTALGVLLDMTAFARALAERGYRLPDLHPRRFEVVSAQAVRLVNTWELSPTTPELAFAALREQLGRGPALRALTREDLERVRSSSDFDGLLRVLDKLRFARVTVG